MPHLSKGIIIAFLVGWAFSVIISPSKLIGGFGSKSA